MKDIIVVYKSKYGTAEKYARWIAEELECDIRSMDEIKARDLEPYENIIFGGGVHAGGIEGFDVFRKWIRPILKEAYYNFLYPFSSVCIHDPKLNLIHVIHLCDSCFSVGLKF